MLKIIRKSMLRAFALFVFALGTFAQTGVPLRVAPPIYLKSPTQSGAFQPRKQKAPDAPETPTPTPTPTPVATTHYWLIPYQAGNTIGNVRVVSPLAPSEALVQNAVAAQLQCKPGDVVITNVVQFASQADALSFDPIWK